MQEVSVYQYGLRFLAVTIEYYTESCGYLLFYCAAVLFIYVRGSKRDQEIFVPGALMLLLTVYNPLFPVVIDRFFDINQEYYRLLWITPVGILVPYVLTLLITAQPGRIKKAAALAVVLLGLSLTGRYIYDQGYQAAETRYNVPKGIPAVSKALHEVAKTRHPKVMMEYEYNMMIRQYDPSILLAVDRETYIDGVFYPISKEQMDEEEDGLKFRLIEAVVRGNELDPEYFRAALDGTKTEFIVISEGNLIREYLLSLGLTEAARAGGHIIYHYPLEEREDPYADPYLNDIYSNL